MIAKTPIVDKLDEDLARRISASSNSPADLMSGAFYEMMELAKKLEIENSEWKKIAEEFNCSTPKKFRAALERIVEKIENLI